MYPSINIMYPSINIMYPRIDIMDLVTNRHAAAVFVVMPSVEDGLNYVRQHQFSR